MFRKTHWAVATALLAAVVLSPEASASIKLGVRIVEEGPKGSRSVVVRAVMPKSVAARMGINPGDVILRVNGAEIKSAADLFEALDDLSVTVIWRSGCQKGDRAKLRPTRRAWSSSRGIIRRRSEKGGRKRPPQGGLT
jgi:S1-C subfamily serine protease